MKNPKKLTELLGSEHSADARLTKHLIEAGFIFILALALFILFSLISFQGSFPTDKFHNAGGPIGSGIAAVFYSGFGYFAYALPLCMFYFAAALLIEHRLFFSIHRATLILRSTGLLMCISGGSAVLSLLSSTPTTKGFRDSGGLVGHTLASYAAQVLNFPGALLLLTTLTMVGLSWVTGLSWVGLLEHLGLLSLKLFFYLRDLTQSLLQQIRDNFQAQPAEPTLKSKQEDKPRPQISIAAVIPHKPKPAILDLDVEATLATEQNIDNAALKTKSKPYLSPIINDEEQAIPSLSLLTPGDPNPMTFGYLTEELESLSRNVEQHLHDFGIQVDVVAVHPGPVITRFELQLAAGVKVSRLSALVKDLARSLSVTSVRIVEIIPGKTVVGIELPNPSRKMVRLTEVLSAEVYQQAHSPITLALGVDIAGHPMVVDLGKMPHLLVAGTTGSGKSVGINAMILSILFKSTPEQVRLIMVDPKMLELSIYDGIPHLLAPVVTDMKEAASSLRWCVAEMERRYRLMAALGVRNLAGYNTLLDEAEARSETILDPLWKITDSVDTEAPRLSKLPFIVVIIDELADMMMVVGKKVEQLIARIAQKARAAGIHLILATQRPSVDVLTGLIKSNIPTRISFQVSSKIDSRTILDQQGAEQLLGHGDMLFLAPGTGAPLRVHGAFVDDQEVHRIADAWRAKGKPEYIEEITSASVDELDGDFKEDRGSTENSDPLYDEAVAFVMQTRKASISSVQRRFKIGYNRSARLVEEMERCGLVGPLEGGFRDVLVNASVNNE